MKKMISLLLLVSTMAQAQVMVPLKMGELAPFDGMLFTHEAERKFRLLDKKHDVCLKQIALCDEEKKIQNELLDSSKKQTEFYRKENTDLSKQVIEHQNGSFWRNVLYFSLGAMLTGGIVYGVHQVSK